MKASVRLGSMPPEHARQRTTPGVMSTPPNYERFPMLDGAWNAATTLLDDEGSLRCDLGEAEARFLRRKCCQNLAEDDCRTVFHTAVQVAQTAIQFRRSRCGTLPPKPSRRYELLLALAKELEARFPAADPFLLMAGCGLVEMYWDR